MEQKLIEIARKYLEMDGPESEKLNNQLFDLAAKVNPRTAAGKSIIAYVRAEKKTDFSMSAGDEFEAMLKALEAA